MDTRFFHSFLAVCSEGTFAGAADALGVTQPAVSYQMSRLEEQLGQALFERAGRRLVLTPSGRALKDFCGRYFRELAVLVEGFGDGTVERADPIRIASVSGFGRYVLFPLLRLELKPGVRWDLRFCTADEVFEAVEGGEADLGVVYRPKTSSYLDVRELRDEEIVLITQPSTAEMLGPDPALQAIEALPFVSYEESEYVFGYWFATLFHRQPSPLFVVNDFTELEEVVAMVRLGRGVSIVPLDCVARDVERGAISVVRPGGAACVNQVYGVTRAGGYVREEVRRILGLLGR